ncbi:MAG: CHAT domain-containing protein, partial [Symploca sp. SIO2E9]|nr:CHAT domain-containing protein [Symploca sp. SIO2E9]
QQPTDPTDPTDPTQQPTDPTDPTDPTQQPTDPTDPTDPTQQPTDPTDPTDPTQQPTEPTEPTDPTDLTQQPTDPTEPTDPTDLTQQPTEPTDPTDLTQQPTDPTEPTDPNQQPIDPTEPTDPNQQPTDPTEPTDLTQQPTDPTEPTDLTQQPIDPTEPTDLTQQPIDPTEPTDLTQQPIDPTEPTDPNQQPTDPTEPTDPNQQPTDPTEPTDPTQQSTDPTNPTDPTTAEEEEEEEIELEVAQIINDNEEPELTQPELLQETEPILKNEQPPETEPTENTTTTTQELPTKEQTQSSTEETNNNSTVEIERFFSETETKFTREYESYLGLEETQIISLNEAREALRQVEGLPGMKSALIYARFVPEKGASEETSDKGNHELELLVVTSSEKPIRKRTGIKRRQVLKVAEDFRSTVTNRVNIGGYVSSSRQLRKLLVEPIENVLQQRGIQNLIFSMDGGLRSVAVAALYDGKQFLVEQYSVSLIPSLSLTNTKYRDIKDSRVLAMGAEKFTDKKHKSLPAVPLELSMITQQFWQGKSFIDDDFTRNNLQYQRTAQSFEIIHLATHADFRSGSSNNSYIQLWDTKLTLDELPDMSWNKPKVDLLVLSACRTALGNEEAELGFSGLAVKAGVKSSMGSLWYVSDEATLGLMAKFYQQLNSTGLKAEAIRQAQLAMLNGDVKLDNGQLITDGITLNLPPEITQSGKRVMRHPYYWAGFTLVGNPW